MFAPRTGRPAVLSEGRRDDTEDRKDDRLDAVVSTVRTYANRTEVPQVHGGPGQKATVTPTYSALARRVLPDAHRSTEPRLLLPRNLNDDETDTLHNPAFPFTQDVRRLAVVHADLSGLGAYYKRETAGKFAEQRLKLSKDIEEAIQNAVRGAIAAVEQGNETRDPGLTEAAYKVNWDGSKPYWAYKAKRVDDDQKGKPDHATVRIAAFRPIVAGGDDVTFLIRSDLAFDFTRALLEGIERAPYGLSACAGIALVKATTPFLLSHGLAEELCKFAKKSAKTICNTPPIPSALAFYEPVESLGESYEDIALKTDLLAGGARLTACPYGVGAGPPAGKVTPSLDDLLALANALRKLKGRGALRELRTDLESGREVAEAQWRRWRQVRKQSLTDVDAALKKLGVADPTQTFINTTPKTPHTSLFDALTIVGLHKAQPADDEGRTPATAATATTAAAAG